MEINGIKKTVRNVGWKKFWSVIIYRLLTKNLKYKTALKTVLYFRFYLWHQAIGKYQSEYKPYPL